MVYDCFTFFNELDLLEIRLNVLNQVVDKFVLVEMAYTQTRMEKEFYYENNKSRFEKFSDKIIHVKVETIPEILPSKLDPNGNKWQLENYQRDCIMHGLKDAKDDDIILISDLDEIPNPEVISAYKNQSLIGIQTLEQKMMYYFVNNINISEPFWTHGTKLARYIDLKDPKQDLPDQCYYEFSKKGLPTYLRFCNGKMIKNGGWHFSYCGGVDAIIKKRQSICEQHFNTSKNMTTKAVLKKIYIGKDILDRKEYCYKCLRLDKSFPEYIRNNKSRYKKYILSQNFLQKLMNCVVILNCKMYLNNNAFKKSLKQFEKKVRKTLSPYKKTIFKIIGR
ncbi:MAG: hypothetical protein UHO11_04285 [Treponema sp.]|nr:hypothetical protein [Treponema sp.]